MTAPATILRDAPATLQWALERYGAVMVMADIKDMLGGIHESTWRDGVKSGRYPDPIARGKWSTEAVINAVFCTGDKGHAPQATEDPFDCYPVRGDVSQNERRPQDPARVVLFPARPKTSPGRVDR